VFETPLTAAGQPLDHARLAMSAHLEDLLPLAHLARDGGVLREGDEVEVEHVREIALRGGGVDGVAWLGRRGWGVAGQGDRGRVAAAGVARAGKGVRAGPGPLHRRGSCRRSAQGAPPGMRQRWLSGRPCAPPTWSRRLEAGSAGGGLAGPPGAQQRRGSGACCTPPGAALAGCTAGCTTRPRSGAAARTAAGSRSEGGGAGGPGGAGISPSKAGFLVAAGVPMTD
jgi:hypothetical protein